VCIKPISDFGYPQGLDKWQRFRKTRREEVRDEIGWLSEAVHLTKKKEKGGYYDEDEEESVIYPTSMLASYSLDHFRFINGSEEAPSQAPPQG
jgi:hypothetical protein